MPHRRRYTFGALYRAGQEGLYCHFASGLRGSSMGQSRSHLRHAFLCRLGIDRRRDCCSQPETALPPWTIGASSSGRLCALCEPRNRPAVRTGRDHRVPRRSAGDYGAIPGVSGCAQLVSRQACRRKTLFSLQPGQLQKRRTPCKKYRSGLGLGEIALAPP